MAIEKSPVNVRSIDTHAISIEQFCRMILQKAIDEELVIFNKELFPPLDNPMQLSAGDLCGLANYLNDILHK